jgi:hypothetical protein
MATKRELELNRDQDVKDMKRDIKHLLTLVTKLIEKTEDNINKGIASKKK